MLIAKKAIVAGAYIFGTTQTHSRARMSWPAPPTLADDDDSPWSPNWIWPNGQTIAENLSDDAQEAKEARTGTGRFAKAAARDCIIEKIDWTQSYENSDAASVIKEYLLGAAPPNVPPSQQLPPVDMFEMWVAGQIIKPILLGAGIDRTDKNWCCSFGGKPVNAKKLNGTLRHRAFGLLSLKYNNKIVVAKKGSKWIVVAPETCLRALLNTGLTELDINGFQHALAVMHQQDTVTVFDPNFDGLQVAERISREKQHGPTERGYCATWVAYRADCNLYRSTAHDDLVKVVDTLENDQSLPLTRLLHALGARYIAAVKRGLSDAQWQRALQGTREQIVRVADAGDVEDYKTFVDIIPQIEATVQSILRAYQDKEATMLAAFTDVCAQ